MKPGGVAVLNGDDDKLATVKDAGGRAPVFYGKGRGRQIRAENITPRGIEGTDCRIVMGDDAIEVHISVPGEHMVYNAMAAAAVGRLLGLSPEDIREGIIKAGTIAGRCNILHRDRITIIDDCYNANPHSMRAALDLLSQAGGRKIAVLGDMFELGSEEYELHYNIGKYAAEKGIDYLLCVGERSAYMKKGAEDALELTPKNRLNRMRKVVHMPDLENMPEVLKGLLEPGDTVLIKASHSMGFEKILEMV